MNCSEELSLALDNANDAFGFAQSYFLTHQYLGAERLLSRPFPIPTDVPNSPFQLEARDRVLNMTQRGDKGACTRKWKQEDDNINVLPKSKSKFLF